MRTFLIAAVLLFFLSPGLSLAAGPMSVSHMLELLNQATPQEKSEAERLTTSNFLKMEKSKAWVKFFGRLSKEDKANILKAASAALLVAKRKDFAIKKDTPMYAIGLAKKALENQDSDEKRHNPLALIVETAQNLLSLENNLWEENLHEKDNGYLR